MFIHRRNRQSRRYPRQMIASPLAGTDATFVGRKRELAVLERCAVAARHGDPRVVIIEGPAGAGKSSLLGRFVQRLPDVMVVRGSGAEPEMSLAYGLIGQLVAAADMGSRDTPPPTADPLVVGADLAGLLTRPDGTGLLVVLAIDDLHWADPGSAAALLFALRRMQGAAFLGVLSTRAAEIGLLGDGWSRFVNGDHRVTKLRVGALTVEEVQSLACAVGAGELSPGAAFRLVRHTGGNLGYCRAVLEECSPESWKGYGDPLPVPRQLAGPVLARLSALAMPAQALAAAAAVIGRSSLLATAAALAGLPDPVPALGELAGAGLAEEQASGSGSRIVFCDALTHQVIYAGIGPVRRRQLHLQAAALGGNDAALRHRIAAAAGRDAALAADLEAAGREAAGFGAATAPRAAASAAGSGPAGAEAASRERMTQAAAWLAHASAMSPNPADSGRLILDAVEILLSCGEVAEALAAQVAETAPGPRRSVLLGQLDLLAARPVSAEALLSDAWQAHDPASEPLVGAQAATGLLACCLSSGRLREAVAWGERAVGRAGADALHGTRAVGALALALAHSQRGQEALARLDSVPAPARFRSARPMPWWPAEWSGSSRKTSKRHRPTCRRLLAGSARACRSGMLASAWGIWLRPSIASDSGTMHRATPSWPSRLPARPGGSLTSASRTGSPHSSRPGGVTGQLPPRTWTPPAPPRGRPARAWESPPGLLRGRHSPRREVIMKRCSGPSRRYGAPDVPARSAAWVSTDGARSRSMR